MRHIVRLLLILVALTPCAARAAGPWALSEGQIQDADGQIVQLWGAVAPPGAGVADQLRAREALADMLLGGGVVCEARPGGTVYCKNAQGLDLGLSMVQAGYLLVDQGVVEGTALADSYRQAEDQARAQGLGAWAYLKAKPEHSLGPLNTPLFALGCILAAMALCHILIIRRISRLQASISETRRLVVKKGEIEHRERTILAAMLEAELRANKTKLEAFAIIYREQRAKLGQEGAQAYRRAGDIIHSRPALERVVFERVTDRLHILGPAAARAVAGLYEDMHPETEYIDLAPGMDTAEISRILDGALAACAALAGRIDRVLPSLEEIAETTST